MHSEAGFWCGSLKGLLWLCRGIYCWAHPSPSPLQRVMVVATPWHGSSPGYRISAYFGLKFTVFVLHGRVRLVSIRPQQTRTCIPAVLSTEPCSSALVQILSVCICLCPSSPTTSQSFVMRVRWSIYSLPWHRVLGMGHWSNFFLRVLSGTLRPTDLLTHTNSV